MPVIFNEPLSFLQRLTEYMEHTSLIHQANTSSDSIERMKVVYFVPQIQPYFNWIICLNLSLVYMIWSVCLSAVGSVWLRLRFRLWPPNGSGLESPSTHCWEKPMNWSGKWDYTANI